MGPESTRSSKACYRSNDHSIPVIPLDENEREIVMMILLFCTNRQAVKLFAAWERERGGRERGEREGEEREREEGEREERGRGERERGGEREESIYLHCKPVVSLSQVHVTVSSSQYQLVNHKQNHNTDSTKGTK